MRQIIKWTGAIALSLLAHAGGAMLFEPGQDDVQMAGGAGMEVALLGNAFEETVQAGDLSDVIEPTEETPEELTPTEIPPVQETVDEVEPTAPDVVSEQPSEVAPAESDVILPAEQMPIAEVPEPAVVASVPPVETVVPQPRPEPPKTVEKVEKPEPKREPVKRKKIARKRAGEAGNQAMTQVKGQADGVDNAAASKATGAKGSTRQAGNAAVSNYPGKVRRKLNRAFRYPAEAKRQGLRGVAHVSFTVTSGGGLAGVRIAKSAGSALLDGAALDAVRRAAPFPAIPAGAERDKWVFTIPLEFKR